MRKIIVILGILIISLPSYSQSKKEMKKLASVVKEIQAITQEDNGRFLGIKYEAPILFVNPETRHAYAFDIGAKPYMTILEDSIPLGNTAIKWKDKMWAMIGIPLSEIPYMYESLILHEMYHVLQPQLGFNALYEMPCAHLGEEKGAILLRLEMQALLKAFDQRSDRDSLHKHLTNALTFRNSRYNIYPNAKEEENTMELNEGMAEYTMLMMVQHYSKNKLSDELLKKLFHAFNSHYEQEKQSFTRTFAYETISLYGYLIQMDTPDWHLKVNQNTNLTDYFMQILNVSSNKKDKVIKLNSNEEKFAITHQNIGKEIVIELDNNTGINLNDGNIVSDNDGMITYVFNNIGAEIETNFDNEEWKQIAFQYNYENIATKEHARTEKRIAEKNRIKERFLCNNHVELPLLEYSYDFDPFGVLPVDDIGVLHTSITLYAQWGKVETSNGLILDTGNRKAILTPIIKSEGNTITGDGWILHLNDGWEISKEQGWMEVKLK